MIAAHPDHIQYQHTVSWIGCDPIYGSTACGRDHLAQAESINRLWHDILLRYEGNPVGIEMAHRKMDRFVTIAPSTDQVGVSLHTFSPLGYLSKKEFATSKKALEQALCEGYVTETFNTLAFLSVQTQWSKEQNKKQVVELYRKKDISLLELIAQFNKYDRE
jgi:hypothetical protein